MKPVMVARAHYLQIVRMIIVSIVINVVDVLAGTDGAANFLFSYNAMLMSPEKLSVSCRQQRTTPLQRSSATT